MSLRPFFVKTTISTIRPLAKNTLKSDFRNSAIILRPQTLGLRTFHWSKSVYSTKQNLAPETIEQPKIPLNTENKNLSWNDFLALRVRRRRVNLISSCFTAFLGVSLGWGFIANIEIDPTQLIFGFDPAIVYSLALVICGGLGYLVGPSLGDIVFKNMIRKQAPSFIRKDAEFLRHIRKNRPDPSNQNHTANPVTDYYGEKIGSLKDYRRWLRDGRAYRKKLEKFL
jgi:mitochondrial import inner membrane translocase subunit TIM23